MAYGSKYFCWRESVVWLYLMKGGNLIFPEMSGFKYQQLLFLTCLVPVLLMVCSWICCLLTHVLHILLGGSSFEQMGFVFSFIGSFPWQPLFQFCWIKDETLVFIILGIQKALLFQKIVLYFKRFSKSHVRMLWETPEQALCFHLNHWSNNPQHFWLWGSISYVLPNNLFQFNMYLFQILSYCIVIA